MMFRQSLLIGVAFGALAGAALIDVALTDAAQAQTRRPSREDLLDELTRHIQICSEIGDGQQRLACYDKVQTQVGDVPSPQPTPLAGNPPPPPPGPPPGGTFGGAPGPAPGGSTGGLAASGTPLSPPPLGVPGGGVATLGPPGQPNTLAPPEQDPDRAFNPSAGSYRPPETIGAKPQPPVRRTGPRPLPNFSQPMPLVTLTASNLTYGEARYWQVTISVTSNTANTVDTQIQCTFRNAGRSVGEAYFGPVSLASGEQITTDLIGPPTTAYVDSTNCRVLSP